MVVLITTLFVIVVSIILRWFYKVHVQRRTLQWMPGELGLPIIGIAGELKENTEFLKVFGKYTKRHSGLCWINIFTTTTILATDYKFIEFFLTSNQVLNKGPIYGFLTNWLGKGLLTAPGTKWKQMRKILTPAFHFSILEQFIPIFESNCDTLLMILNNESKKDVIDIAPFITMYTLDNICETAMGVKINAQTNNQSEYVKAVKEMCNLALQRTKSIIRIPDLTYPLSSNYYKEKKIAKMLHSYTDAVVNSRREEIKKKISGNNCDDVGSKRKMTFLDLLLETTSNGEPLSNESIRDEVNTFMFAGHDTTSSALCSIIYCLANHPEVQKKAWEEQKHLFEGNMKRNARYGDLQEMKYLEKVIKETLRLYPSVPFVSREHEKDVTFKDGKVVPAGVEILFFIHGINRNPDVFPNPDKFDPDRFDNISRIPPYSYIPFSAGPRNCIGQKFAMLQLKITISKLLRKYEISSPGSGYEPIFTSELVFHSTNGIHVTLKEIEIKE